MKLAYITSAYGRASDTFIRNEVKQLRSLGHVVETFSIRRPDASHVIDEDVSTERSRTTYLLSAGVLRLAMAAIAECLRSPCRFTAALQTAHRLTGDGVKNRVRECAYVLEASLLAGRLRTLGCQHIHDHIGENSAVVAAVAARLVGITYSMTLHGPSIFYAPEQFRLGEKIGRSAFVACISSFSKSQCMAFCRTEDRDKLNIIHCPVGVQYAEAPPTSVPDVPRLLSVGRLSREKGQMVLLDAVARLRERGVPVELDIVGDGPSRGELENRIRELRLEDCTRLSGWQTPQEIVQRLQQCRAFVLPSFSEGLPIVLMEALALSRPVVTTWVGGIPELVEHGASGWLVPPGSVEALADAMEKVLQTPVDKLTGMGLAGRAKVLRDHNAATEAAKLAELFLQASDAVTRRLGDAATDPGEHMTR